MVEARLERSQAEAKAQRAQQRLDDFLAEQPAVQVRLVLGPIASHSAVAPSCHIHLHQNAVMKT